MIAILDPGLRESIEPPNRAAIHAEMVGRFRGNVDLGRLETEPVAPSPELATSPPDEPKAIAVDRLTERNTVDRVCSTSIRPPFCSGRRGGISRRCSTGYRRARPSPRKP